MMKTTQFWMMSLCAVLLGACADDNTPEHEHEEELITTVNLSFNPQAGGDTLVFSYTDMDADGPEEAVVTQDTLEDSTTYFVSVEFWNEAIQPPVNLTAEVLEESTEHQLFFQFSQGLNLTHSYNDIDAEGNPLGLENIISTGEASTGEMSLILRHQPEKDAAGVADGDIGNAGGSTDVEVSFEVVIIE